MTPTTKTFRTSIRVGESSQPTGAQREWLRHVATLSVGEVYDELNTSERGLASAEVEAARTFYGENAVSHVRHDSLPRRVLAAFADPFTYILIAIAVVSVLTDYVFSETASRDLTTPLIIGVMVLVSGTLRFVQGERSGNAAQALAEMIETTCNVQRADAGRSELPLDEVVVGDIIHLSSGDIVPADLRIVRAHDLFVSQSSLTGESEALEKLDSLVREPDAKVIVSDLVDLAFMGSTVISGTATGVVVATGTRTLFGEATATLGARERHTAFDEGLEDTSRLLVRLMLVMVPAVLLICGLTKGDWIDSLLFSLSVAVGLTPEMLPMLVTCCLGKGAVDMSREHVIVKRLDSIQDLGAIDVLCTDKTGTLTENRVVRERHLDVMGNEDARVLRYAFLNSFFETGLRNLIDSAIISRALEEDARDDRTLSADDLTDRWRAIDELPFSFERRRVSVVVGDDEGRTLMITKGAIEEILSVCSMVEVGHQVEPLTPELVRAVMTRAEGLSDQGMRVLGVAKKDDPAGADKLGCDDECEMVLIGYLAFLDPPKEDAAEAIRALAENGVSTKVLTGDSARVAVHVCEAIGIPVNGVLTGSDLEGMSDTDLAACVQEISVFAKLSPAQKARVVRLLRELGHAVGYMGDGVNDAAAMDASDCGISVESAVDVTREAADIILLEKDLMVLERGIICGRRTYANMVKYVKMTVSSNFGNIISVIVASTLLPFLPMAAVQLLLLNLIYDLSCTAIPWDNVDDDLVHGPRRWDSSSVRSFMFLFGPVSSAFDILTFAGLFFWICPMVVGQTWANCTDPASQALFVSTFQAGWFVESMWTQTLAIHLMRTTHVPFVESHASLQLTLLGAMGIVLATVLPFTAIGATLDFAALPISYFALLACAVGGYVTLLVVTRRMYARAKGELL